MTSKHRKSVSNVVSTLAVWLLALVAVTVAALAQPSSSNELSQYTSAVAKVQRNDRLMALEQFAIRAHPGPLRAAALEFIIWEYLRVNNVSHAMTWANDLGFTDKDNAIALALLSDQARNGLQHGSMKPSRLLAMASRGLDNLSRLQRPLGMNEADFVQLQRQANAMLSGAAGAAELEMRDYIPARIYLHNAVAVEPNHAANVYALGLADLDGKEPNKKEGYWCLARAVNLSKGTPQGMEIARFARARYVKDGGSTSDWNQFLTATASPNAPSARATRTASITPPPTTVPPLPRTAPQPATVAKTTQPATVAKATPPATSALRSPAATKPRVSQPPPPSAQPAPSVWADNSPPAVVRKRTPSTVGPMSLGILIETSLTNKGSRSAVTNSLVDMLRHIGDKDEAFILTYDNKLVFEQDLTNDPQQLEDALQGIKPQHGAVLDDAIAFAAGHLARIAKYPNRVLLVVSDGRNIDSQTSPLQTSAEINAAGVRIFCIGVDVSDSYGRSRLQALSSSTGGQVSFVSNTGQFRRATREMAQNMGIDFRF